MGSKNRKMPFEVPEGYFEALPQKINQRIVAQSKSKWPTVFFVKKVAWASLPMAVFIVFAILWFMPKQEMPASQKEIMLALDRLPQEEIEAYLLAEGFTEGELLEVIESKSSPEKILPLMPAPSAEDLEEILDTQDLETFF